MTVLLGALYHWAPADRRAAILLEGLVPGRSPTVTINGRCRELCLSPTPAGAWTLSGALDWVAEIESWDLWQVELGDRDEVHVLPSWGPHVKEIRVRNTMPPDRVWWVGQRGTSYVE